MLHKVLLAGIIQKVLNQGLQKIFSKNFNQLSRVPAKLK
jgi:hypothetical protein